MSDENKVVPLDEKRRKKKDGEEILDQLETVAKHNEEARERLKKRRKEHNDRVKREYQTDKGRKS